MSELITRAEAHCARWHRYLDRLIETNALEITCLLYMSFCYIIHLWPLDVRTINWLSIYLRTINRYSIQLSSRKRALTPLPWQSHRDKRLWNHMSSLYVILFCNLFVTIWCKDNKQIFYSILYELVERAKTATLSVS